MKVKEEKRRGAREVDVVLGGSGRRGKRELFPSHSDELRIEILPNHWAQFFKCWCRLNKKWGLGKALSGARELRVQVDLSNGLNDRIVLGFNCCGFLLLYIYMFQGHI